MVQNSFSLLFLLVLAAGAVSLLVSLRGSWGLIVDALLPQEAAEADAKQYSTTLRAAAEVPWVAQRLVLRELDEPLPPPSPAFAAWAPQLPPAAAERQMAFPYPA